MFPVLTGYGCSTHVPVRELRKALRDVYTELGVTHETLWKQISEVLQSKIQNDEKLMVSTAFYPWNRPHALSTFSRPVVVHAARHLAPVCCVTSAHGFVQGCTED